MNIQTSYYLTEFLILSMQLPFKAWKQGPEFH